MRLLAYARAHRIAADSGKIIFCIRRSRAAEIDRCGLLTRSCARHYLLSQRHDIAARNDRKRLYQSKQSAKSRERKAMYTLYSMQRSGNSYKVRLALAQLGIPYRLVEIDILKGESRTPEFLAMNPSGQVPLLEVAPGRYHRRDRTRSSGTSPAARALAPDDRIDRAEALQWMFFEQHSLEPNIGAAYFWLALVKGGRELQQHALEDWMEEGYRALGVMENHLKQHRFFAADRYTVADIALYAYTHLAHRMRLRSRHLSGDPRLARPRGRTDRTMCRWTGSRRRSRRSRRWRRSRRKRRRWKARRRRRHDPCGANCAPGPALNLH